MNLYTLTAQDQELYNLLSGDDEIPEEQLYEILQASEDAIHIKAARVVAVIKTLKADSDAHAEIAAKHSKKAKTADNACTRLSDYLLMCMEKVGLDKVGTLEHGAKIPKPRASLIIDADCDVPEQYKTIKEVVTIDKTAIKADILAGSLELLGAEIVYKKTLKIE
jgi:hypothetical protein